MKYNKLTLYEACLKLKRSSISSQYLVKECLKRILKFDKITNNFTILSKHAFKEAILSDERRMKRRPLSPLDGIPISVKDIINTTKVNTNAGSYILKEDVPTYNATVINKLKKCGAIVIGKSNLDEFAMGSSTESSIWGTCRNLNNATRIVGGSSGGSVNSVSTNMCLGSLGTDTGGSIRQPASFCDLAGLRPTFGRISRFGMIAFASSFDQIGIATKDPISNAMLLQYIAGYDSKDSSSSISYVDNYLYSINSSIKGLAVGIPIEYLNNISNKSIEIFFNDLIYFLKSSGIKIKYISLNMTQYIVATYYILAMGEASSNLSRFIGTI